MIHRSIGRKEKRALDDDDLQELIWEGLDADPVFQVGHHRGARIDVEVDDGEVTLHGVVRTALDRRKADILARALGATTVDNRLRIEPEAPAASGGGSVPVRQAGVRGRGRPRNIVDTSD